MAQSSNIAELTRLGFSPLDIDRIKRHGYTDAQIIYAVNDLIKHAGATEGTVRDVFEEAMPELFEEGLTSGHSSLFKTLDQFEQKQADWLFQGYIPKGQITTLASDGGIGKTSLWVSLAAAVSSGEPSFLDHEARKPGKVLFMSTEDSVRVVLKKRLVAAGAAEHNIITPDFSKDETGFLRKVKFGTQELEDVISAIKPDLCIFDPLQGFLPQGTQMGDRAAMRNCLAPLISLGEKYGTTFLIICHTNKRQSASGRNRIADSADLWDISRSVLMMGWTEDKGVRYLSQEKCNYGPLQETILFSIDRDGVIHPVGTTWKRDREFQASRKTQNSAPKRNDCKDWILETLMANEGSLKTRELEDLAKFDGYSPKTLRSAKDELKTEGKIYYRAEGFKDKTWYIHLAAA